MCMFIFFIWNLFDIFYSYFIHNIIYNRRFERDRKYLRGVLNNIIETRRQQRLNNSNDSEEVKQSEDFLNRMLDAQDERTGQKLDSKTLADNLMTILFAGYDTTSFTLTYALYLLSKHPKCYKKIQEEVDRVSGGESLSYSQQQDLKYTYMVIKESLRLYPPASLTVRSLLEDVDLDGYIAKAGTEVLFIYLFIYLFIFCFVFLFDFQM